MSLGRRLKDLEEPKEKKRLGRPKLPPKEKDEEEEDEILICQCGNEIRKSNMRQHLKTTKHKDIMKIKTELINNNNAELQKQVDMIAQLLRDVDRKINSDRFAVNFN